MARIPLARRLACRLVAVLLVVTAPAGCSYAKDEPGLFGHPTEPPTAAPTPNPPETSRVDSRADAGSDLPVVGEAVWTSGEGRQLQLRIAVHAVRRIPGATVLDWSITPLPGPDLDDGDALPRNLDLGLTPTDDDLSVFLVDAYAGHVYRPLVRDGDQVDTKGASGASSRHCLCTPLEEAQRHLTVGEPRLLQIAFPPLPSNLSTVDVDVATVPMFWHVPVTGPGQVPTVTNPVDLTRAPDVVPLTATTPVFGYGPRRQQFVVSVDAVYASSTFTSVQWTVQSLTPGPGLDAASDPPLVDRAAGPSTASGLRVAPSGSVASARPLSVRLMSVQDAEPDAVRCLCTQLRDWASSLRQASQQVSLVTNLPPLPRGTQAVDVVLPGLTTLKSLPVTAAPDASTRSAGPVARDADTWTYRTAHEVPGWPVSRWPTPLPATRQLSDYRASVEDLRP